MEKREEIPHERLKQQLSELEQEWTAMKTCKSFSAVSWITVEEALGFVDNSPRKLMLSLQQKHAYSEADTSFRRNLFHEFESDDDDFDDERKATSFCPSSCVSSNVMRGRDGKKTRGRSVVSIIVVMLLSLVLLIVLINDSEYFFIDKQMDTLVPT